MEQNSKMEKNKWSLYAGLESEVVKWTQNLDKRYLDIKIIRGNTGT